ncbi:hypothetical protein JCM19236_3364 [Vibrio sp. JCM 19236]|nr:hypothetical protein JCM19236_3364 [Vibrio sp. JCM 19236]
MVAQRSEINLFYSETMHWLAFKVSNWARLDSLNKQLM